MHAASRRPIFVFLVSALLAGSGLTVASPQAWAKKSKKKGKKKAEQPKEASAPMASSGSDPERDRLKEAVSLIKGESYGAASTTLFDLATSASAPDVRDGAAYHLGKALYRMKLHHSALEFFTQILEGGPKGRYYRSALEWCLFIARKIKADARVLEAVAKYSDGIFPDEYRDEFHYLLARHHYLKGRDQELTEQNMALGDTTVSETETGGLKIKGDIFGDEGGEEDESPAVKEKKGGGFSVEEDIFGDPEPKKEEKKEEAKPAAPTTPGSLSGNEHFAAALKHAMLVDQKSAFAAKAKFLEAVLLYREQHRENDALEAFKSVVRLTKPGAANEDADLRQLAFVQLARSHFGAKQPSFSIFYYDKMERFTYDWLEAIYESSWAEFRLGSYEKSLGNLLTLHSPFFREEYFPESHILKAVVYYENCRYPEAEEILAQFKSQYGPVHDELNRLTGEAGSAQGYYEILENLKNQSTNPDGDREKARILSQILGIALSDPELQRADDASSEIGEEIREFDTKGEVFARSALRDHLETRLTDARQSFQGAAGKAVKRKLEAERDHIKTLLGQALRIEIETVRGETERLQDELRGIKTLQEMRPGEFVEWADDEKLVWPFQEEYWRDELGTYELTLAYSCRVAP